MIYNIHYDICAILISFFSIIFTLAKKGFRQRQTVILYGLFCITFGAAVLDIMSAAANSYINYWSDSARYSLNYGYLAFQNIMPYLVCCYVVYVVGLTYRLGRKQVERLFILLAIPWGLCILLLATNPFTHSVFYFDENTVYRHGFAMYILYALAILYLAYSFYLLIRYGHRAVHATKIMIMILEIATVIAIILQMILDGVLLQLFVESLCLLGLLVTVENESEIVEQITTCYNRTRFTRDCALGLETKARFEVILIRIPALSVYTASMGIDEVNKVMRAVGKWFRDSIKKSEVYYCDGGCFTIICDKSDDSSTLEPFIRKRFLESFTVGNTSIRFRPSVSHITAGVDFDTIEQLMLWIDGSDEQLMDERAASSAGVRITDYKKELIMQRAIERALSFDEFEVMYQPIWNARTNIISDAEALVRLYDDADGLISPEDFIPFSEKRGYIVEIGEYVFESVCRFIATHELKAIGIERIHINLSPYQCMNERLAERFEEIRNKYNVPVEMIVFEIAESSVVNNFALLEKTIKLLHEKGYSFALDNYGKGSMDMTYLFQLPFSILKLDKQFLWKAEGNLKASIFFSGTMRMAKEMNMKTVVLGVEVPAQKTLLQNYECDYLQGFYYQKAIASEQFYRYCVGFNSKE